MVERRMSYLLAASTPQPTPISDTVNRAAEGVDKWWTFLIGAPLRIAILVVLAIVVTFVVRLVIRKFARKIAEGTTAVSSRRFGGDARDRVIKSDATSVARRAQRAKTVGSLLSSIAVIIIFVIMALMIMQELGYNPAPILASAGVAGVAIGFGAQSLVRDYLSGFFIVAEDQYGIGDTVDLGEAVGVVEDVGLRSTKVRGIDGTLWHVPNGEILRVGNQSQGWARAVMDLPVPYDADQKTVDKAIHAAVESMRNKPDLAPSILEEPEIWGVQEISGNAVTIRTVIKTKPNEQWGVARAFRAEIQRELRKRGITIAIPAQSLIGTMPGPQTSTATTTSDNAENKDSDS